jgi:glutaryl-CoA dehydrogenase
MGAGLVNMEVNRGDGSLGTFLGVQSGLAMKSIDLLGSDEQKARWLPGMASVDLLGAFALTEPTHGSDSVALETSARRDGSDYVLNGAKRWIGNATIADVVVVWARDEQDGQVKGFLVEGGTPGFDARRMEGKVSSGRSGRPTSPSPTCASRPTPAARCADVQGHRPGARLDAQLGGVGRARPRHGGVRGGARVRRAARAVRQAAEQLPARAGQARADARRGDGDAAVLHAPGPAVGLGPAHRHHLALAKLNNTRKAREVILEARELLGGNGILLDFHVVRHMADIEAIYTYEGTADIQELIVGRKITGQSAFT